MKVITIGHEEERPSSILQLKLPVPSICLNMIVKNEAAVVRRCLDSVRPIIAHWVIVDTGSTDGTQDIIRNYLRDLPGELHERPWRDFAQNRSEALELARGKADYTLIIDADDVIEIAVNTALPALRADLYTVQIDDAGTFYRRPQLMRSALPWRFEGVLHEYLTCDGANPPDHLPELRMRRNHDGARRNDPDTYRRDVAVLANALRTETRPFLIARYQFYLANSYRDCGDRENALKHYLLRAGQGFWQEEVFVSLYLAAEMKQQLGHPEQDIIDAYLRASDALPSRAEALHRASRFCRIRGRYAEGCQIAERGLAISLQPDALFVEPWVYETGLLDEFAINAYWCGRFQDCLDASLTILASGKLGSEDVSRVAANAQFASEKLSGAAKSGSVVAEAFLAQHALEPERQLRTQLPEAPRVLVAILAKQKEEFLPLYLECIEALDYPKSAIVLCIRTNNNTDGTERILRAWVDRVGSLYAGVELDTDDVPIQVQQFGAHEWNAQRFSVLGRIRRLSLERAIERQCDFYFVADVDNFIRPCTLRELVALNLPIVAPFLRSVGAGLLYSNYHAEVEANGYFKECDQYEWVLSRSISGVLEVPVVHCTYLIRSDVMDELAYEDETDRHEYVIFSETARRLNVMQYLDNRQVYGYIAFAEGHQLHVPDGIGQVKDLLSKSVARTELPASRAVYVS